MKYRGLVAVAALFVLASIPLVESFAQLNSSGSERITIDSAENWLLRADPEEAILHIFPSGPEAVRGSDTSDEDNVGEQLTLTQSVSATYVDVGIFDLTVRYVLANETSATLTGLSLIDSSATVFGESNVTISTAPFVWGPSQAGIALNASWDGSSESEPNIFDADCSLGPGAQVSLVYTVRVLLTGERGYLLTATATGAEVDPETSGTAFFLEPPGPLQTAPNIMAFQYVEVIEATATTTTVRIYYYAQNPTTPGGPEPSPVCGAWEFNPAVDLLDQITAITDTLEAYIVAPSTYAVVGNPVLVAVSEDVNQDGLVPVPGLNLGFDGTAGEDAILCSIINLGPGEYISLYHDVEITHGGDTTWENRIWAHCWCGTCVPVSGADDAHFEFEAPAPATIATRMTLSAVTGSVGARAFTCSLFVSNPGVTKIESIDVIAPIEDSFGAGTDAFTSVSNVTSALFPGELDVTFDGSAANANILVVDAGNEIPAGDVDTVTFDVLFDEGDQVLWEFKATAEADGDGGSPAVEDTTNCGPDVDLNDDLVYDELLDNAPCSWTVEAISTDRIELEDLTYEGAFRMHNTDLADYAPGVGYWHEDGDPGNLDAYPGSLLGTCGGANGGTDWHYLVELAIPEPSMSTSLGSLPFATILTGPTQIVTAGGGNKITDVELYWTGAAWKGWFGTHYNEDSYGAQPKYQQWAFTWPLTTTSGPWAMGYPQINSWETNQYNATIDPVWASLYMPGKTLFQGRYREGQGHFGPNLFAFEPWKTGAAPAANTVVAAFAPEIMFQWALENALEEGYIEDHVDGDIYGGAAWIGGSKRALVLSCHNKGSGGIWYGKAKGVYGQPAPNGRHAMRHTCTQCDDPDCHELQFEDLDCDDPNITCVCACEVIGGGDPCPVCPASCEDYNQSGYSGQGYNAAKYHHELQFYDIGPTPAEVDMTDLANGTDPTLMVPYFRYNWSADSFRRRSGTALEWEGTPNGLYTGHPLAIDNVNRKLYVSEILGSQGCIIHVYSIAGTP